MYHSVQSTPDTIAALCSAVVKQQLGSSFKALRLRKATPIEIPLQQVELKAIFRQVSSLHELEDTGTS
jgi:hypothetical protein